MGARNVLGTGSPRGTQWAGTRDIKTESNRNVPAHWKMIPLKMSTAYLSRNTAFDISRDPEAAKEARVTESAVTSFLAETDLPVPFKGLGALGGEDPGGAQGGDPITGGGGDRNRKWSFSGLPQKMAAWEIWKPQSGLCQKPEGYS